LVCEEGTLTAGWGSEVISRVTDTAFDLLRHAPVRVAALDTPIANTRTLEEAILPSSRDLVQAARQRIDLLSAN
jgi:pyruvate/2-oxoglutarate/acetoin dehydrogenase E1 component